MKLSWSKITKVNCRFFFISLFLILFYFFYNQTISVTDIDAFSYIEGAHSLSNNNGYNNIAGNNLHHWPIGYSYILSFFDDILFTSFILNSIFFGLSAFFIFKLVETFEQKNLINYLLSFYILIGFLFSISIYAKPDILNYSIFFLIIFLQSKKSIILKNFSLVLTSLMIFLKSISIIFLPAIILTDLIISKKIKSFEFFIKNYLLGIIFYIFIIYIIFIQNLDNTNQIISPTHPNFTINLFLIELKRFVYDFFRMFIFSMKGPLSINYFFIFLFFISILNAFYCFFSFHKISNRYYFTLGLIILIFSWTLQFIKIYYATPRLLGYGLILILLSCSYKFYIKRWISLIIVTIVTLFVQYNFVDFHGAGAKNYITSTIQSSKFIDRSKKLYTNSYKFYEINFGIKTYQTDKWPIKNESSCLVEFKNRNNDRIFDYINSIEISMNEIKYFKKFDEFNIYCI